MSLKFTYCRFLFISFFLFGIFFSFSTYAQIQSIAISPLAFELSANPGSSLHNILKISNSGSAPVTVTMDAEGFVPVGEEGKVVVKTAEDDGLDLASWITIDPKTFTIKPQSTELVTFTIIVPDNADPGGHYGSVLAGIGGGSSGGGGSIIAQKVGALLLLKVSGEVIESLDIKSVEIPRFSEYGPITIAARFRNTGTVHLKPKGFIIIKNMFGSDVAELALEQKNVLPNSVRRIETVFDKKYLFGRYDAILTSIYGSSNEPLSFVTSFWVIPWKFITVISIIVLLILALFYVIRKRIRLALKVLFRGEKSI